MKITTRLEFTLFKRTDFRALYINLIPGFDLRFISGQFGKEFDIYLSWLLWGIEIAFNNK